MPTEGLRQQFALKNGPQEKLRVLRGRGGDINTADNEFIWSEYESGGVKFTLTPSGRELLDNDPTFFNTLIGTLRTQRPDIINTPSTDQSSGLGGAESIIYRVRLNGRNFLAKQLPSATNINAIGYSPERRLTRMELLRIMCERYMPPEMHTFVPAHHALIEIPGRRPLILMDEIMSARNLPSIIKTLK